MSIEVELNSEHNMFLKNIYSYGMLSEETTCKESLQVQLEDKLVDSDVMKKFGISEFQQKFLQC